MPSFWPGRLVDSSISFDIEIKENPDHNNAKEPRCQMNDSDFWKPFKFKAQER